MALGLSSDTYRFGLSHHGITIAFVDTESSNAAYSGINQPLIKIKTCN
jgi:hypothetical protein